MRRSSFTLGSRIGLVTAFNDPRRCRAFDRVPASCSENSRGLCLIWFWSGVFFSLKSFFSSSLPRVRMDLPCDGPDEAAQLACDGRDHHRRFLASGAAHLLV